MFVRVTVMARGGPIKIVYYAINGRGLGHLVRITAIARAVRRLCDALDVAHEMEIVTTSDASSVAGDFPVYKLPSKTAVARAGAARDRYALRAKLVVSNLVAAQAPDLLVLDTVPYGAFQELAFLRGYCRATAYVYRHQDPRAATSDLVQRHLELFDRIVVPDDEAAADAYPVPRGARARVAFVGGVHAFDEAEAWDRERVRAHFGVPPGRRLVWVSAGGGGDGRDRMRELVLAVAEDPRSFVLAGYGPLHRGECVYAPNVVPLVDGGASRYFLGLDAAVSAAGYNAYEELLAARVPALFFAQPKGLDRQDLRIASGLARGWHAEIPADAAPELVRGRLDDLLEGDTGLRVRAALAEREAPGGALGAAVELLAVCASLDKHRLDRAALFEAASWLRGAPRALGPAFVAAARAYGSWRTAAASAPEVAAERDAGAAGWWSGRPRPSEALAAGAELVALREASGLDDVGWRAVVRAFAEGGGRSHLGKLEELIGALRALVPAERDRLAEAARSGAGSALRERILGLAREEDARPVTH